MAFDSQGFDVDETATQPFSIDEQDEYGIGTQPFEVEENPIVIDSEAEEQDKDGFGTQPFEVEENPIVIDSEAEDIISISDGDDEMALSEVQAVDMDHCYAGK